MNSASYTVVGTILDRLIQAGARRLVITTTPTGVDFCHDPQKHGRHPISHWWLPVHRLRELDPTQVEDLVRQASESLGVSPADAIPAPTRACTA